MFKRLFIVLMILLISASAYGAIGSCVGTLKEAGGDTRCLDIVLVCTGGTGAETGTVTAWETDDTNTFINSPTGAAISITAALKNAYYLLGVEAYPTAGGTAPASGGNVLVKNKNGLDWLGSIDGTTAYRGLSLIHATIPRGVQPDQYNAGQSTHLPFTPRLWGNQTVSVTGHTTSGGQFTIELHLGKQ